MSDPSDQDLVQKSLENIEAFGALIERYEQRLLRYILRISSFTVAEAEELLQEVFLKAWKNLNDYDQSLSFSSWIYRIAHNHTISQFRKAKSRGDDRKISIEGLYDLSDDQESLAEEMDRQLKAEQVRGVLELMEPKYRDVLVLKYFEGKSYEDMSDILQCPMGTIATLMNRAKKSFAEKYQHHVLSSNPVPHGFTEAVPERS